MLQTRTDTSARDGIDVSLVGPTISITTSGSFLLTTGNIIAANTWYHCAVTRNGSLWALWINGGSSGNFNFSDTTGTQLRLGVKTAGSSNEAFDGYISNFRYVRGTALYTSRFTPPIDSLSAISGTDLLLNTFSGANFLNDSSGNNRAITNNNGVTSGAAHPFITGSGITGLNQTFQIPVNSAFTYGTGDFTVEWFSNQTSSGGVQGIWRNSTNDATNAIGFWTVTQPGGRLTITLGNGTSSNTILSNAVIPLNNWHHYAIVRNGTLFKLYVDGVAQTQTITSSIDLPAQVGIMQIGNAGGNYNGYVTSFRIVKGTAVYTSDFTPPTAQLTAISGTSLLLNYYSAGLARDSSPFNHTITNTGSTFSVATPFISTSGIVTSNLALSLDAGDLSSYPGSGTLWSDSVSGKLFILSNGGRVSPVQTDPPTYNSANGGYIQFDNSKRQWANCNSVFGDFNSYSIDGWWYLDAGNISTSTFNLIADKYSSRWNYALGMGQVTSNKFSLYHLKAGQYGYVDSTNNADTYFNTGWMHICGTYNNTTGNSNLYINGTLAATEVTIPVGAKTPQTGSSGISVATRNDATVDTQYGFLNGGIAVARIYNGVLSSAQVTQNYNAQRARFGL
jgi:hypothetical protein